MLALTLPLAIPFGDAETFSVAAAADVAAKLAAKNGLSFRQIKRILDNVELALRCYRDRPLDCSLLVYLAFRDAIPLAEHDISLAMAALPRVALTPAAAANMGEGADLSRRDSDDVESLRELIADNCSELVGARNSNSLLKNKQ